MPYVPESRDQKNSLLRIQHCTVILSFFSSTNGALGFSKGRYPLQAEVAATATIAAAATANNNRNNDGGNDDTGNSS